MFARVGFHRGLHPAEGDELDRLDDGKNLDCSAGFGSAARGEAKRDARLDGFVDDDEICAHVLWRPLLSL